MTTNPTSPDGATYESIYSVQTSTNVNINLQRVYMNVTNIPSNMYYYAQLNTANTGITLNAGTMNTIRLA